MTARGPRHGLARALSKRGVCSRTQAAAWIAAGRVAVDGRIVRDPEHPTTAHSRIAIDGASLGDAPARVVVMLNKPRGLVTTTSDEQGRRTIYSCLGDPALPWLAPVGRLDKASEGLLLLTNDPAWAARMTDPATGPRKTYHVQVDALPGDDMLAAMRAGVHCDGEVLSVADVRVLRSGGRTAWLEIVLDEGRNRQIRRVLEALGLSVQRLVRVAIGGLALGDLAKGGWRVLPVDEVDRLVPRRLP